MAKSWIVLANDRGRRQDLVKTVTNFRFHEMR